MFADEIELSFPCEYPVKMIGKDEDDFASFVAAIITNHVPGLEAGDFTAQRSSGGKYISVSVTFIAESRAQVNAIYAELGQHPRILVAF